MRCMLMFKVDAGDEDRGPACKTMPEMERLVGELKADAVRLAEQMLMIAGGGHCEVREAF